MNTTSLVTLWNHTQQNPGTSGAKACAQVLLGLYNGLRFPMDLTDLRTLDDRLLTHAIAVIDGDSRRCQREVHEWLNILAGRRDMQARFEALAWEYNCFKRGRGKKSELVADIGRFTIEMPTSAVDDFDAEIQRAAPIMTGPVGLGARRQAAMKNEAWGAGPDPYLGTR